MLERGDEVGGVLQVGAQYFCSGNKADSAVGRCAPHSGVSEGVLLAVRAGGAVS